MMRRHACAKSVSKREHAVAKRIVAKAKEHQIPVMENKPVARAIYGVLIYDEEIPPEMYMAIAEIWRMFTRYARIIHLLLHR